MKYFITLWMLFFASSYSQQKPDKPPKFPPKNQGKIEKVKKTDIVPKTTYVLTIGELKTTESGLSCWKTNNHCHILDGKVKLYSYYQTSGNDTPTSIPYTYAEGEFLQGKHQGIWMYYNKNGKVIKNEKWNNGKLIYRKEYNFDTCDNLEKYEFSNTDQPGYHSIDQFKKDFSIKSGKLFCKNGVIESMRLTFLDETTIRFIPIYNGHIGGHNIQIIKDPVPSGKRYYYDKEGNVERISEVKNELLKGNGHYIDYYYPKNEKSAGIITTPILKAEGEIKNNFKYGEWKYYNKNGIIDSIKTYTQKDSVDVRFPHCIFNKKEPCYSEKKSD